MRRRTLAMAAATGVGGISVEARAPPRRGLRGWPRLRDAAAGAPDPAAGVGGAEPGRQERSASSPSSSAPMSGAKAAAAPARGGRVGEGGVGSSGVGRFPGGLRRAADSLTFSPPSTEAAAPDAHCR